MEAVANQLWNVFLFLADPRHMVACAVLAFVPFYILSWQPLRSILFAVCFPGMFSFVVFVLGSELTKIQYFRAFPPYVLAALKLRRKQG